MSKKLDRELMELGEDIFWDEFEFLEQEGNARYVVVDQTGEEVLISNARLIKEKKKIRV